MAFKKRQPKQSKQKREFKEPDGKISLWVPDDGKKYVISGTVMIGDEKYRVFIYENNDPLYDNSPEYYGSLYLDEEVSEPRGKKSGTSTTKRVERFPKADEQGFDEDAEDDQEEDDDSNDGEIPF